MTPIYDTERTPAQEIADKDHEIAQRVGRTVATMLDAAGISRRQCAAVMDVSYSALSRRIRGEVPFDLLQLDSVAHQVAGVALGTYDHHGKPNPYAIIDAAGV